MQDNLEEVPQEMIDELEVFGEVSFYMAMDFFNKGKFPNMEYYRSSRGIDNDHNVFYKFIKHINGEPQFKAENSKKYVVRSKKVDDEGMVTAERAREITDEYESALISALFDEVLHIILGAASSNKSSVIISDSSDSVDFSYYPGHALFTNLRNDGGAEKLEALGYEVSPVSESSFGDKKHMEQSEYFKISW